MLVIWYVLYSYFYDNYKQIFKVILMYMENAIFMSVFLLARRKHLYGLSYNNSISYNATKNKSIICNI